MGVTHQMAIEAAVASSDGDIRTGLVSYRQTRLQACLLARCRSEHQRVVDALEQMSGMRWLKQAKRVQECCSNGRVYIRGNHQGGSVGLWVSRCGHRCCPFCAERRSRKVEGQIRALLSGCERPRHVVLTRRHDDLPLSEQIRCLRNSWRSLRLSVWGRHHFKGGIYVIEITRSPAGSWHPHLHIVYEGLYVDQRQLADKWSEVASGSRIVWISAAWTGHARYLAKYVGKPADIGNLSLGLLSEYIEATNGLRMVQPWGTAHGPQPSDGDPLPPPPPADSAIPLSHIARRAAAGHVGEQSFLRALVYRYPLLRAYARAYVDVDEPPGDIYSEEWRERADDELSRCLKLIMPLFSLYNKPLGGDDRRMRGKRV